MIRRLFIVIIIEGNFQIMMWTWKIFRLERVIEIYRDIETRCTFTNSRHGFILIIFRQMQTFRTKSDAWQRQRLFWYGGYKSWHLGDTCSHLIWLTSLQLSHLSASAHSLLHQSSDFDPSKLTTPHEPRCHFDFSLDQPACPHSGWHESLISSIQKSYCSVILMKA